MATVIPFDDEDRGHSPRQRHDLRAVGLDLDPRRRPRAARRARDRHRRAVDQLQHVGARRDPVRRLQAIRLRPRARSARARRVHRGQVDLLRDVMSTTGRLQGKVCVITGVAGGIGSATAALFAREGARVVGVDLAEHSIGELPLQADVADEDAVRSVYARAREELGRVDVLFNNAGISPNDDASVLDTTLEAWERVQAVNLRSVFLCCKHGIPHLLDGGGGSVINTASFVAILGAATSQISYTASKGGVLALSRELGRRVRAPGRQGQRPVPRAGRHAAAARAVRQRSRAGRPALGARADGTLRPSRGDRQRRPVPRQRRVELHHRHRVHGRRWHHRRIHHAHLRTWTTVHAAARRPRGGGLCGSRRIPVAHRNLNLRRWR